MNHQKLMKNKKSNKTNELMMKSGTSLVLITAMVMLSGEVAMARDLASAARTYTSTIKTIGQVMSVAGVIAGGICMQIPGVAQFGRGVLSGGLIGGLCSFGAPAFAALLTTVFGGG